MPERQVGVLTGRARRACASVILVVALGASLAACDLVGSSTATGTGTPKTATASPLNPLLPAFPKKFTSATAGKETIRVADEVQDLIAKTDIVYVDDHHKVVAKTETAASYYGVLRTVSVDPKLDAIAQATAMAKLLETGGWIERQTADDTGKYLIALASSRTDAKSWFLLLGADTADKKPVITIQLASPDLP